MRSSDGSPEMRYALFWLYPKAKYMSGSNTDTNSSRRLSREELEEQLLKYQIAVGVFGTTEAGILGPHQDLNQTKNFPNAMQSNVSEETPNITSVNNPRPSQQQDLFISERLGEDDLHSKRPRLTKLDVQDANAAKEQQTKLLFEAIYANCAQDVLKIVEAGIVDLNMYDAWEGDGTPPLAEAINLGHSRIARMLIKAGADVNLGNDGSIRQKFMVKTPLNCAIELELVGRFFLREQTSEDAFAANGLVQLLLLKGAHPNEGSLVGTLPLQRLFCWRNRVVEEGVVADFRRLFCLLVEHGATVTEKCLPAFKDWFRSELSLMQQNKVVYLVGSIRAMPNVDVLLNEINQQPANEYLNLGGCGLTDYDIEKIVVVLNNNPHIAGLSLHKTSKRTPVAVHELDLLGSHGIENSFTLDGVKKLANLLHVQFLDVSGNYIGEEGVVALSKMPRLRKLWALDCGIPGSAAKNFLAFQRLEFLHDAYNESNHVMQEQINQYLQTNRYNNASNHEQATLRHKELQQRAIDAALGGNIVILKEILPQLPKGANDVEGDDNLLLCAASAGHVSAVEYLLICGAHVESHDKERQYTSLFVAAENGHPDVVLLLLQHCANMSGEFDFNKEDAISITIHKIENIFRETVAMLSDFLSEAIQKKITTLYSYLDIKCSGRWQLTITNVDEDLEYVPFNRWEALGSHPNKHEIIILISEIGQCLVTELKGLNIQERYPEFMKWQSIAYFLANKVKLIKGVSSDSSSCQYSVAKGPVEFHVSWQMKSRECGIAHSDIEPLKQLGKINNAIKNGLTLEIDSEGCTFYLPQYRGLHFYTNHFNPKEKEAFLHTNFLNRNVFSGAAFEMSYRSTPKDLQLTRESTLDINTKSLKNIVKSMSNSGPVCGDWPKARQFANERDLLQQRYSNSMPGFKRDLQSEMSIVGRAFGPLNVRKSLPFISTSDNPLHALRYCYGLKPDASLTKHVYNPLFQSCTSQGEATDLYIGILFIYIFPISKWLGLHPHHVPSMHHSGAISIGHRILSEEETSFVGSIPQECNWLQIPISIPGSKQYQDEYLHTYGLDKKRFSTYTKYINQGKYNDAYSILAKQQSEIIVSRVKQEIEGRGGYAVSMNKDGHLQLAEQKTLAKSKKRPIIFSNTQERHDIKKVRHSEHSEGQDNTDFTAKTKMIVKN